MEVPNHLAIIPDGNRRWARERGVLDWMGHREGAEKFEEFLNWCLELGVTQVSAYVLSTENLNRPKKEVDEIFRLFYGFLRKWEKEKSIFDKYEINVRFVGDLSRLPPKLIKLMDKIMMKTAKYQKRALNTLIAYGGRLELTETIKKIAEKAIETGRVEITEREVTKNLSVPEPVDLVIRTGGLSRLSNLLLWQAAYAEIYVTDTLWPNFTKRELIKAIEWYNSVQRNFGK